MTNHSLPNEDQRKALCELIHHAFVELRYIEGEQAHDLAYAFHNVPIEIYGWGSWSPEDMRTRLKYYHEKYLNKVGPNFLQLFNNIFPEI